MFKQRALTRAFLVGALVAGFGAPPVAASVERSAVFFIPPDLTIADMTQLPGNAVAIQMASGALLVGPAGTQPVVVDNGRGGGLGMQVPSPFDAPTEGWSVEVIQDYAALVRAGHDLTSAAQLIEPVRVAAAAESGGPIDDIDNAPQGGCLYGDNQMMLTSQCVGRKIGPDNGVNRWVATSGFAEVNPYGAWKPEFRGLLNQHQYPGIQEMVDWQPSGRVEIGDCRTETFSITVPIEDYADLSWSTAEKTCPAALTSVVDNIVEQYDTKWTGASHEAQRSHHVAITKAKSGGPAPVTLYNEVDYGFTCEIRCSFLDDLP